MGISIRERIGLKDANASVCFDGGVEYLVKITNPFSSVEEKNLEWYFEEHIRFPFTDQVKADNAALSIKANGEALFAQVFADFNAKHTYKKVPNEQLTFEIVGSAEFQSLHWEAMKDPDHPRAFALDVPVVRCLDTPRSFLFEPKPSPTINLLVVTARPKEQYDVDYRTITRPVVESIRNANLRVQVELLRPGSYEALIKHLEIIKDQRGVGYYHAIHFDVHGALLEYKDIKQFVPNQAVFFERFGHPEIENYDGKKAFLFFEGNTPEQPVEASILANLLASHEIPIVILNACQSGKQVGAQETSLGYRLMQAGAKLVLAMKYTVTVSAAKLFVQTFYQRLFDGLDLSSALRHARLELYNCKIRQVCFNQKINLEDWLLPVIYQSAGAQKRWRLSLREFTDEENKKWFSQSVVRYQPRSEPKYGFLGRDSDILKIERRLIQDNIILVQGMGGAGKTSLLHHLGGWWQTTRFIEKVFYFGYDERAWTRQQIMRDIAISFDLNFDVFNRSNELIQQQMLVEKLRSQRHLLILDNLESITGQKLSINNTLRENEQKDLFDFLADLKGGKTFVLLGSRSNEDWLQTTAKSNRTPLSPKGNYILSGLDFEAASDLTNKILEEQNTLQYQSDPILLKIIKLLHGYPLALEVVLSNLPKRSPKEILQALDLGDVTLDEGNIQDKTQSVLLCIEYSYSNLSEEAQQLLVCLAPFTGFVSEPDLPHYSQFLKKQPPLSHLSYEKWPQVINELLQWGLLSRNVEMPEYIQLQPVLPFFLRSRSQNEIAINDAFCQLYLRKMQDIDAIYSIGTLESAKQHYSIVHLEYENIYKALRLTLDEQKSFWVLYVPLRRYLGQDLLYEKGLELDQQVLAQLDITTSHDQDRILEILNVIKESGVTQMYLRRYADAIQSFEKAISIVQEKNLDQNTKKINLASLNEKLGSVYQEQRLWSQAKKYCKKSLAIFSDLPNNRGKLNVIFILGVIAEEQADWEEANKYFNEALALSIQYQDKHQEAHAHHELGITAQNQKKEKKATMHYKNAISLYEKQGNFFEQARSIRQLGILSGIFKRLDEAENYFKSALQIYVQYPDIYEQGFTYSHLGEVNLRMEKKNQGKQYLSKALNIFKEYGDKFQQARIFSMLATEAFNSRDYEEAEKQLNKAVEIFSEYPDKSHLKQSLYLLCLIALLQKKWKKAEKHGQEYLPYCDHYKSSGKCDLYAVLAHMAYISKLHDVAERYYLKALDSNNVDDKMQGILYQEIGIVAFSQKKFSEANKYTQSALRLHIQSNNNHGQMGAYNLLGLIAKEREQLTEARDYFFHSLIIAVDSNYEDGVTPIMSNLAHIWHKNQDRQIVNKIAEVMKTPAYNIEALLQHFVGTLMKNGMEK